MRKVVRRGSSPEAVHFPRAHSALERRPKPERGVLVACCPPTRLRPRPITPGRLFPARHSHSEHISLQPSALWPGACGHSTLSPVAGGSSGPAGLSLNVGALGMGVGVGMGLPGLSQLSSLPTLPLAQLAPPSPDELNPAAPPGPPSPSAANMPLSLTHH
ncbi:hypothetical protein BIW11_02021, partial [Tropilaelaps mercedesae]